MNGDEAGGNNESVEADAVASAATSIYHDTRYHELVTFRKHNWGVGSWPKNYFLELVRTYEVADREKDNFVEIGMFWMRDMPTDLWNGQKEQIFTRAAVQAWNKAHEIGSQWERYVRYKNNDGPAVRQYPEELPSTNPILARNALDYIQLKEDRKLTELPMLGRSNEWIRKYSAKLEAMIEIFALFQKLTPLMREYVSAITPMISIHDKMEDVISDITRSFEVAHTWSGYWDYIALRQEAYLMTRCELPGTWQLMNKLAYDRPDIDNLAGVPTYQGLPLYGMDDSGHCGPLMSPSVPDRYRLVRDEHGVVYNALKLATFFGRRIKRVDLQKGYPWVAHKLEYFELTANIVHGWIRERIDDYTRDLRSDVTPSRIELELIRRAYILKFTQCTSGVTCSFKRMTDEWHELNVPYQFVGPAIIKDYTAGVPEGASVHWSIIPTGATPTYTLSPYVRRDLLYGSM